MATPAIVDSTRRRGSKGDREEDSSGGAAAGDTTIAGQENRTTSTQSQFTRMSNHPRHTTYERPFTRYKDSAPSRESDELDSLPLSYYKNRIITPPQAHQLTPKHDNYETHAQQQPLIDRVTNEWRNKGIYHDYDYDYDYADDSDDDDERDAFFTGSDYQQDLEYWRSKGVTWLQRQRTSIPKPVQRMILFSTIAVLVLLFVFTQYVHPWLKEHAFWDKVYTSALQASQNDGIGVYGSNMEVEFDGMIQVKSLDSDLLPHGKGKRSGRLIFIGDVHGCKHELQKLLKKADFDKKRDHVILTGDMVNKGPDTPGTVDLLRDIGASCVRGNHEDKVLLVRHELARKEILHDADDKQLRWEDKHMPSSEARARKTARELSGKQAAWLAQCPVILQIGALPEIGELVAVHAGLAPGVPLKKQDPFQVMNMRSMDPDTRVPSENRDLEKWDKVWAEWQARADKKDRMTVVYGHDSKRGLNVKGRWALGLDSGCVNGGELTALTVDAEGTKEIVQVKCSDANRD